MKAIQSLMLLFTMLGFNVYAGNINETMSIEEISKYRLVVNINQEQLDQIASSYDSIKMRFTLSSDDVLKPSYIKDDNLSQTSFIMTGDHFGGGVIGTLGGESNNTEITLEKDITNVHENLTDLLLGYSTLSFSAFQVENIALAIKVELIATKENSELRYSTKTTFNLPISTKPGVWQTSGSGGSKWIGIKYYQNLDRFLND